MNLTVDFFSKKIPQTHYFKKWFQLATYCIVLQCQIVTNNRQIMFLSNKSISQRTSLMNTQNIHSYCRFSNKISNDAINLCFYCNFTEINCDLQRPSSVFKSSPTVLPASDTFRNLHLSIHLLFFLFDLFYDIYMIWCGILTIVIFTTV